LWLGFAWILVLIVILSSLAPAGPDVRWMLNDKIAHAAAYAGMAFWFSGIYLKSRFGWILAGLLLLGLMLELVQGRLSYRTFDLFDLAANAAGVALGLTTAALLSDSWCAWVERRLLPGRRGGGSKDE
jgi:VanZ family protein